VKDNPTVIVVDLNDIMSEQSPPDDPVSAKALRMQTIRDYHPLTVDFFLKKSQDTILDHDSSRGLSFTGSRDTDFNRPGRIDFVNQVFVEKIDAIETHAGIQDEIQVF